jgi:hypothetical protein
MTDDVSPAERDLILVDVKAELSGLRTDLPHSGGK